MWLERALGCGLAAAALAGVVVGCGSSDSGSGSAWANGGYASGSSSGATGGSSSGSGSGLLVVDIDPNATLVQTPGNGIGVYVEYETGGHWNVTWTCDTNLTGLSCPYIIDASVAQGTITSPVPQGFGAGDSLTQPGPQDIEAITTTMGGVDQVTFDTDPGTTLQINVRLNAPVSFFFVQDGKVNGGYKGSLTNPLIFQPTSA